MIKLGIIGGTGLSNMEILQDSQEIKLETRFGSPSSIPRRHKAGNLEVIILSRHGRQHTLPPTQVNHRANIQVLKDMGVTHILASTAVGSLREEIGRGDLIIPDQFIDFTRLRPLSIFSEFPPETPLHTSMPEPFDADLRNKLIRACEELNIAHHKTGTVLTIEGPRFSTRAESRMYRIWGADIVNMSIAPECIMAAESGIPYAALAMSTDYDSWKVEEKPVTWQEIMEVFSQNVDKVLAVFQRVIKDFHVTA